MVAVPRVAIAAFALFLATPALAQVASADIVGRVTDASGAVLPGVTVTAENLSTHETASRRRAGPATMRSRCCQ